MEFLDTAGVATLWGSVKNHVKSSIDAQQFKTINGTSIKGAGDIQIDLSLYKVVEVLPTSNIDTTKIYLVKDSAVDNNSYSEYMYVGGKWEKLGDFRSSVDLQPYAKTEYVNNQLATKVDKVAGKGLSTNDYTTTEKNKLAGIAANANNYTLPTATETTLGGIKVDFIPKDGNCLFKVQRDVNGNANTFIPGLKYGDDECLSGVQVSGDSHTSVTYTGNGVTFNDQYGQKVGNIRFRGTNGYFALTSDIPDVYNLCRFNFVNSISECKSNRINFLFRCPDYMIDLGPFDSYPDGTILLISITNNSIPIKHQSGIWFCEGDEVSANYTAYIYKEGIKLITKYVGKIHYYSL